MKFDNYLKLQTKEVSVGNINIGGKNPIRIQSMLNTKIDNVDLCVKQIIDLYDSGCEMARLSVPKYKDIEALDQIIKRLKQENISIPLIADIHFSPKIAEECAKRVAKVRVNPGNYTDKKIFSDKEYSVDEYNKSINVIEDKISGLIDICKYYGTVLRIGSNHGSLSDRIISRYGNTPKGMVESAMEFVRICVNKDYYNLVLSMKSSDVKIMIYATRLLVNKMIEEDNVFPLHLGVTEAGAGVDGRIKSACGIGTLLQDGIGDTIRVSLTEDPVNEIAVAKDIINSFTYSNIKYSNNINDFNKLKTSFKDSDIRNFFPQQKVAVIGKEENDKSDFLISDVNSKIDFNIVDICDNDNLKIDSNLPNLITYKSDILDIVKISSIMGKSFIDNKADAIFIDDKDNNKAVELSFDILQACGSRITKVEFVSCPACGRTNYDIESVLAQVKEACKDFTGLKIAVMGCVVNGLGEMADADFGVVGANKGKLHIYKQQTPIKKNIPQEDIVKELLEVISQFYSS